MRQENRKILSLLLSFLTVQTHCPSKHIEKTHQKSHQ